MHLHWLAANGAANGCHTRLHRSCKVAAADNDEAGDNDHYGNDDTWIMINANRTRAHLFKADLEISARTWRLQRAVPFFEVVKRFSNGLFMFYLFAGRKLYSRNETPNKGFFTQICCKIYMTVRFVMLLYVESIADLLVVGQPTFQLTWMSI